MTLVHVTSLLNGWWNEKRPIPELLCLLHSEVSEALEAYRNHDKENLGEELADIAIRLFDMVYGLKMQGELDIDYDLEEAIIAKDKINRERGYKHGSKRC